MRNRLYVEKACAHQLALIVETWNYVSNAWV